MLIYPPFLSMRGMNEAYNEGYHYILDPPGGRNYDYSVNIGLLAIQYIFVVTIGAGLLFFLKPKDKGGQS
ncbi:hypothetical protein LCGC14_1918180 [marine sediment metagenome]|uniref:Uncharacterized protein n=1 Tax=marine sediment metagenome TaxID=412755 RepID=A0A0F9FRC3_9ZZZZ